MRVGSGVNARSTTRAGVRAGALALLTACAGGGGNEAVAIDNAPHMGCFPSDPPMPAAHIGPDATILAFCDDVGTAAVASVDDWGSGITAWSASVQGVPADAFSLKESSFKTCQAGGPSVAFVSFLSPKGALPGDAFDAVVAVHADDGSFADGTVNVHAEVVFPSVLVDKTTVDFGDVLAGDRGTQLLTFLTTNDTSISIHPTTQLDPPFSAQMVPSSPSQSTSIIHWGINFESSSPGDYSTSVGFSTAFPSSASPACQWTTTIGLHARVLGDGGVADGGPDGDVDSSGASP